MHDGTIQGGRPRDPSYATITMLQGMQVDYITMTPNVLIIYAESNTYVMGLSKDNGQLTMINMGADNYLTYTPEHHKPINDHQKSLIKDCKSFRLLMVDADENYDLLVLGYNNVLHVQFYHHDQLYEMSINDVKEYSERYNRLSAEIPTEILVLHQDHSLLIYRFILEGSGDNLELTYTTEKCGLDPTKVRFSYYYKRQLRYLSTKSSANLK